MKAMRQRARLTQRQAGELVGVSAQAVGQWESGATSPEWNKLRALDEGYGAGGALLALFNDEIGLSRLDELTERLERQAKAMLAILRTLRDLEGVDPEALPGDDFVMRSVGS